MFLSKLSFTKDAVKILPMLSSFIHGLNCLFSLEYRKEFVFALAIAGFDFLKTDNMKCMFLSLLAFPFSLFLWHFLFSNSTEFNQDRGPT